MRGKKSHGLPGRGASQACGVGGEVQPPRAFMGFEEAAALLTSHGGESLFAASSAVMSVKAVPLVTLTWPGHGF